MSTYKVCNDDLLDLYEYSSYLIYHWNDILDELSGKIACINHITLFFGETAEAAKNYMTQVHVQRLIPSLELMLNQYQSMLVQYIHAFTNVDDYEHFYLDGDVIEQARDDFHQIWNCVDEIDDQLSGIVNGINDMFEYELTAPDAGDMTAAHARLNYRLETIGSEINCIEHQEYRERLNSMEETIAYILQTIIDIENCSSDIDTQNTTIDKYAFQYPNLSDLDLQIQQMDQYIKSNETEIQECCSAVLNQVNLRYAQAAQEEKASQDIIIAGIGITVGTVCIILSLGTAAPLVLSAGFTFAGATSFTYGLSKELDFEQRNVKIKNGDTDLDTFNIIRDGLFGGNEELYDTIGMVSIGVSAIGIDLMSGGEFNGIATNQIGKAVIKTVAKQSAELLLYKTNELVVDYVGEYYNLSEDEKTAITFVATVVEGYGIKKLYQQVQTKIGASSVLESIDSVPEGGSETVNRINEIKVDFNYNNKYDETEFARQLADQEKGMNELTVQEYLDNRARYIEQGRAIESNAAQQVARENAYLDKVKEYRLKGSTLEDAEAQAQEWLNTQAALHNPDQIAGGNPLNIGGLGDKGINSSIGAQWKYRIDAVDEQINAMAKNMTEYEKENTYLNVNLSY